MAMRKVARDLLTNVLSASKGEGLLARILSLIYVGDFLTYRYKKAGKR